MSSEKNRVPRRRHAFLPLALASAWIAAFGAASCTDRTDAANDPKTRLNGYISQSFSIQGPQDRKALSSYLTGDARSRMDGWSDEQFRMAFVESKRKFIKLAFKEEKPVSADEMTITYELTYQNSYADDQGKPHDAKVTQRKLAQMVRENGKWMIGDVRSLKELVEYKDEMSLP